MPAEIVVAHESEVVSHALAALLEKDERFEVVANATSIDDLVTRAQTSNPDLILCDVSLAQGTALAALVLLKRAKCRARVVILDLGERFHLQQALAAGATAYLGPKTTLVQLTEALTAAATGRRYVDPSLLPLLLEADGDDEMRNESRIVANLTGREVEVLRAIANGHSTKEVASSLGISVRTAEGYRSAVMRKFSVHNAAQLVRVAYRVGVIA